MKEDIPQDVFFLAIGYKKDIFAVFTYDFELSHQSRQSRVYHQDDISCISSIPQELYIIKPQGKYTLVRDEIQGQLVALDDIPTCVG